MASEKSDLRSIDYDTEAFKAKEDPRFKACQKDMTIVEVVILGSVLLVTFLCYLLGSGDPGAFGYFMGYPLWVSLTTTIFLVAAVLMSIFVLRQKRFSFDAKADNSEVDY